MKKCGIFAIAALMTVLCGRLDAQVQSDVVGYTTTTVEGKKNGASSWYQIAIQFKGLGETEDKIKLGEAINAQGLTPTTWRQKTNAPCMQIYNGVGYDMYYYVSNARAADGTLVTGWANASQQLANEVYLSLGEIFWFKADNISSDSVATITVAGVVSMAQTTTEVEVGESGLTALSNPYPTSLVVKEIGCTFTPTTWRNKSKAACIQVYNGVGYDMYYYVTQARAADGTLVTGWANSTQQLATNEIPVGTGFWLKSPTDQTGKLTFTLN